jgi:hypothetical protein
MMIYRRRLAIIMSAAVIWFLGSVWLAFNPKDLRILAQHSISFIILYLSALGPSTFVIFWRSGFHTSR